MNKKIIKKLILIGFILQIVGCTTLDKYFGERNIDKATNIYNKEGITIKGVEKLAKGIEAIPDSSKGVILFNVQYSEIVENKRLIMKKNNLSKADIEKLKIFMYASDKAKKLSKGNNRIKFNNKDYEKSQAEIVKKVENYILKEEVENYTRREKIRKIREYENVLRYIPSLKINQKKLDLEKDVTRKISFSTRGLGYDTLSNIIRGEFHKISNAYMDKTLGEYIYFKGYRRDGEADYLVELDLTKENISTRRISIEETEKGKIFVKEKELVISGYYSIFKISDRKLLNMQNFEIKRNYTVRNIQEENSVIFESEREIIEKIIEEELESNFFQDIKILLNSVEL